MTKHKSRWAERQARYRKCLKHDYRDTTYGDIRCRLCGKTTTQQRVDAAHKLAEYRRRKHSS